MENTLPNSSRYPLLNYLTGIFYCRFNVYSFSRTALNYELRAFVAHFNLSLTYRTAAIEALLGFLQSAGRRLYVCTASIVWLHNKCGMSCLEHLSCHSWGLLLSSSMFMTSWVWSGLLVSHPSVSVLLWPPTTDLSCKVRKIPKKTLSLSLSLCVNVHCPPGKRSLVLSPHSFVFMAQLYRDVALLNR